MKRYCEHCKVLVEPKVSNDSEYFVLFEKKIKINVRVSYCPLCNKEMYRDDFDDATFRNLKNYYGNIPTEKKD